MKTRHLIAGLCLFLPAAYAQETTAGGNLQNEASWAALQNRINATNGNVTNLRTDMNAVLKCNNAQMFYAPSVKGAVDGCVVPKASGTTQYGLIEDATSLTDRTKKVVFPTPFTKTPKVYLGMQSFLRHGKCSGNTLEYKLTPTNVTRTGFTYIMQGQSTGCGDTMERGVTWIAVEPN